MTVRTIRTIVPAPVDIPRGAVWAGEAAAWVCTRLRRLWYEDTRPGEDLLALAHEIEPEQPCLATELRGMARHRMAQAPAR